MLSQHSLLVGSACQSLRRSDGSFGSDCISLRLFSRIRHFFGSFNDSGDFLQLTLSQT